jgi:hypothetical protein
MRPRILSMAIVFLALPRAVAAEDFGTDLLEVGEGTVRAVRARDLTGDGRLEIAAFWDGPAGVAISVFRADDRGALPKKPTAVLRPADHGLFRLYYAFPARPSGVSGSRGGWQTRPSCPSSPRRRGRRSWTRRWTSTATALTSCCFRTPAATTSSAPPRTRIEP